METLVETLLPASTPAATIPPSGAFEFKPLFEAIYPLLKTRHALGGGEEMVRLRAYEKLQALVRAGAVRKTGKLYQGVPVPLRALGLQLRELREKSPR